jgi:hypothetical protein
VQVLRAEDTDSGEARQEGRQVLPRPHRQVG